MATPSPPIDFRPNSRFSSSSPRSQTSNLTSGLHQINNSSFNNDMNRQGNHGRPYAARKDSVGLELPQDASQSAAKPITVNGKPRRESLAGSFMGGRSWGGISVGSWLQDDILMSGTSPYNIQSPSYHSSSYLPKMEANFWNNLKCCDTVFNDLHELLQHFEEIHSQASQAFPERTSHSGPRRRSTAMASMHPSTHGQTDQLRTNSQTGGFQSMADLNTKPIQQPLPQPQLPQTKSALSPVPDMDALGDMEMDDDQTQSTFQEPSYYPQQTSGPPPLMPLNTQLANVVRNENHFHRSAPTTPVGHRQALPRQNNPVVSAVNTPTLQTQALQYRQHPMSPDSTNPGTPVEPNFDYASDQLISTNMPYNSQMLQGLDMDFGNLDFGNGNDMLDLCINDPAKALFSEQGGINTQQFPHFNFSNGLASNPEEAARKLQAQHLAANINARPRVSGEQDRPFRCPVIGCEKAYKNANGLRYHEKHGHSSQKLKENGDGTFSIVDPVTSVPYPGTVGMEKEKPYRCDTCGKRYKNLNGLKYHRNHSPPCNPDFKFDNNITLPTMQSTMLSGEIY